MKIFQSSALNKHFKVQGPLALRYEFSNTAQEIDLLMYQLYRLKEDEIKIVED